LNVFLVGNAKFVVMRGKTEKNNSGRAVCNSFNFDLVFMIEIIGQMKKKSSSGSATMIL
jgi:hypothetical protein